MPLSLRSGAGVWCQLRRSYPPVAGEFGWTFGVVSMQLGFNIEVAILLTFASAHPK